MDYTELHKREIIKFTTSKGYKAYEMQAIDTIEIFNGYGMCDYCNKATVHGYYMPVLNWYLCEKCFKTIEKRSVYHPEDIPFEKRYETFIDNFIKQSTRMKLLEK